MFNEDGPPISSFLPLDQVLTPSYHGRSILEVFVGIGGGSNTFILRASANPTYGQETLPIFGDHTNSLIGFNNWSAFMCGLNESIFIDTAHSMVENGLLAAGYNHINIDDCWSNFDRAANGSMVWNSEKFPNGLPWLTSYLKSLGFTSGIYTDAGNKSCGGYPGAYGYEELDASTFASWGFEYLKLDGCNMPTGTEAEYKEVYGRWHSILSKMTKPMVFSESAPAYFAEASNLTDWYSVMGWVPEYGQLARHSRDTLVFNSTLYWPNITGWDSIMFNYGQEVRLARYQKPGYYNDPDFLDVDHFDLTLDEKRSHFAIWSSLSAPLIISAWIPGFSAEEIEYLTNKDLIAANQDPLALQSTLVSQDGTWDMLTKDLANGDRLLTVINRGETTASQSFSFDKIGIPTISAAFVKDLWTGVSAFERKHVTANNVPSHGTAVFRISAERGSCDSIPTGMIFNTYSLTTLTASKGGLSWANATADDGQTWQTGPDNTLKPLSDTNKCLEDSGHGRVDLASCNGRRSQKWDYLYSGNVKSRSSNDCLTETDDEEVVTSQCLYEANSQVLGLPSGITINGN
ncbi:Alpha-galactosidase A [Lachnellula hyalina]|uniref:Alpha-galactosidase n=1 Tax=Lachnellula hyalina TaxID=1316788 RepID=A0A8H8TZU8_9HELO|nr:Alpha-galactosidase A [Lachnellula hyalina]TVY28212.1 Alpha-galactosidase A [Lachnellula hyalina]